MAQEYEIIKKKMMGTVWHTSTLHELHIRSHKNLVIIRIGHWLCQNTNHWPCVKLTVFCECE